jgi:hypothetical protein
LLCKSKLHALSSWPSTYALERFASKEARLRATTKADVNIHNSACRRKRRNVMSGFLIVLALASILFFSVILITAALMMRGHWDSLGPPPNQSTPQSTRSPNKRPHAGGK